VYDLGITRSCRYADHALITPDTHVPSPWPELTGGTCVMHITPAMGAKFALTTVHFTGAGKLSAPPAGVERFCLVTAGSVSVVTSDQEHQLGPGAYAFIPEETPHVLVTSGEAQLLLLEKPAVRVDGERAAVLLTGSVESVQPRPLVPGSRVQVRTLLPEEPGLDLAVNVMDFPPGASLPFVEVHEMEHGLVMLAGQGIYRLGQHWHPVTAGDIIWMAPFCPQWFAAIGDTPARYLLYKDWNRHPFARTRDQARRA